jgi:hypothetical protein
MRKLLIAMIALAATSAAADTIYFDDGTVYELQTGEEIYVSSGRVWEFTRFLANDLRVQQIEPFAAPVEQCIDQLGFGPEQCTTYEEVTEVVEQAQADCDDGLTFGGGC